MIEVDQEMRVNEPCQLLASYRQRLLANVFDLAFLKYPLVRNKILHQKCYLMLGGGGIILRLKPHTDLHIQQDKPVQRLSW